MISSRKSSEELSRIAKRAVKTRKEREIKAKRKQAGHKAISTLKKTGGHSQETQKIKLEVFSAYSKKFLKKNKPTCFCCGIDTHLDFLTLDHIDGRIDMIKDKKLEKIGYSENRRGKSLNMWLKKNDYPIGFQILCWNCNTTKFLYGKCPHQR